MIAVNTSLDRLGLEQRVLSQTGRTLVRKRVASVVTCCADGLGSVAAAPRHRRPALPLVGVGGSALRKRPGANPRGSVLIQLPPVGLWALIWCPGS